LGIAFPLLNEIEYGEKYFAEIKEALLSILNEKSKILSGGKCQSVSKNHIVILFERTLSC